MSKNPKAFSSVCLWPFPQPAQAVPSPIQQAHSALELLGSAFGGRRSAVQTGGPEVQVLLLGKQVGGSGAREG
ncbi:hypothetical protein [Deinococcus hopiensis]|uniref:Uncharacterized protein n=1 Tax=Deinococcus hopiensis KR-140 TaxID=695939 RepID=A0A1W1UIS3_9DEIO|nr:hypothetical protein [Deinococcus hopiensis]SMB80664.1 hypothetical protein SAMN00790413_05594 [Deinococcus hopiensis KR-140]